MFNVWCEETLPSFYHKTRQNYKSWIEEFERRELGRIGYIVVCVALDIPVKRNQL